MSKISVIVPVYNVEPYLGGCVDSILGQSFRDFDLVLVDDGSPDRCGDICDEYAKQDERVVVIHQANGGLSAARNAGIEWAFANSKSEYLTLIDSDDWVDRNYLQEMFDACKQGCDCVCTVYQQVVDSVATQPCVRGAWRRLSAGKYWLTSGFGAVVAASKLFRKSLFSNVRFPVGRIHEDLFVVPELLFSCNDVMVVESYMYYYRTRQDSISRCRWTEKKWDLVDAYRKEIAFFATRKESERDALVALTRHRLISTYANMIHRLNHTELRYELRKELKELSLPFAYNRREYFAAYPFSAHMAWPFVRIFADIKRIGLYGLVRECAAIIGYRRRHR